MAVKRIVANIAAADVDDPAMVTPVDLLLLGPVPHAKQQPLGRLPREEAQRQRDQCKRDPAGQRYWKR